MNVAIFSAKQYDREFLNAANGSLHKLRFFEPHLNEETVGLATGFEAVCVFVNDHVDAAVIARLYSLGVRLIALRCTGYNNVDLSAATRHGITVVRVPGYSPYSVAEHTLALMLALNRKVHRAYNRVREGNFALDGLVGFDMHGKTVGVIGTGQIGTVVAQILTGFACPTLAFDPFPNAACRSLGVRYVELNELLAQSDIITALPAHAGEQTSYWWRRDRQNENRRHDDQHQSRRAAGYRRNYRGAKERQDRLPRPRCLRGRRRNLF